MEGLSVSVEPANGNLGEISNAHAHVFCAHCEGTCTYKLCTVDLQQQTPPNMEISTIQTRDPVVPNHSLYMYCELHIQCI